MTSDPIADMLTRIRNANMIRHQIVQIPSTKISLAITEILKEEGYIEDFETYSENNRKYILLSLKYIGKSRNPVISKIKRISKPGTPKPGGGGVGRPQGNRGGGNRGAGNNRPGFRGRGQRPPVKKEEPTEAEVQKQVRETLERLQGKSKKGKGAKYRRNKRDAHREQSEADLQAAQAESKILKVTEFVTVSEVATMMDVPVTNIISSCMMLGMMVTMNQRLDAETLSIVAEEFNYTVEFVGAEVEESIEEVERTIVEEETKGEG